EHLLHREAGGRHLEVGDVLLDCRNILPRHRGVARWPPIWGRTARRPGGELPCFQADRPRLVRTTKPVQTLPDVGRKADLALFAVIDNRQPYLNLALDLVEHGASDRRVKDPEINGL